MKKLITFTLLMTLFSTSSCKRDWVCVCTFNDGTNPNKMSIGSSNRDAAEATCENYSSEAMNLGADCALAD